MVVLLSDRSSSLVLVSVHCSYQQQINSRLFAKRFCQITVKTTTNFTFHLSLLPPPRRLGGGHYMRAGYICTRSRCLYVCRSVCLLGRTASINNTGGGGGGRGHARVPYLTRQTDIYFVISLFGFVFRSDQRLHLKVFFIARQHTDARY